MRIVQLNLAADASIVDPGELLQRYHTLTGWSRALTAAGATVAVVQRFGRDAAITEHHVPYDFVADGTPGMPAPWASFPRVISAVAARKPDVVHVNGLMFPGTTHALRAALPATCRIFLQDHSGHVPRSSRWPFSRNHHRRWRAAFDAVNGCSFTARELAERWHHVGLPSTTRLFEIPEASTSLSATATRDQAQRRIGISGDPCVLWVGRFTEHKDPLTVLDACARAFRKLPQGRLWMIVPPHSASDEVMAHIAFSAMLRDRVSILGSVPHERVADYYSAADIFISGSHHEGSGYALIEALACGASPCITAIPAFRMLAGEIGEFWPPGSAGEGAAALLRAAGKVGSGQRRLVCEHFDRSLSWNVVAQRMLAAYQCA